MLEKTSAEGQVHIIRDVERLRESWTALRNSSSSLGRCQNSNQSLLADDSSAMRDLFNMPTLGALVSSTSFLSYRLLNTSADVTDSASLTNLSLPPGKTSPPTGVSEGEENKNSASNLQIWREPVFKVDQSTKLFGTSGASGTETGGTLTKEVRAFKSLGRSCYSWGPSSLPSDSENIAL